METKLLIKRSFFSASIIVILSLLGDRASAQSPYFVKQFFESGPAGIRVVKLLDDGILSVIGEPLLPNYQEQRLYISKIDFQGNEINRDSIPILSIGYFLPKKDLLAFNGSFYFPIIQSYNVTGSLYRKLYLVKIDSAGNYLDTIYMDSDIELDSTEVNPPLHIYNDSTLIVSAQKTKNKFTTYNGMLILQFDFQGNVLNRYEVNEPYSVPHYLFTDGKDNIIYHFLDVNKPYQDGIQAYENLFSGNGYMKWQVDPSMQNCNPSGLGIGLSHDGVVMDNGDFFGLRLNSTTFPSGGPASRAVLYKLNGTNGKCTNYHEFGFKLGHPFAYAIEYNDLDSSLIMLSSHRFHSIMQVGTYGWLKSLSLTKFSLAGDSIEWYRPLPLDSTIGGLMLPTALSIHNNNLVVGLFHEFNTPKPSDPYAFDSDAVIMYLNCDGFVGLPMASAQYWADNSNVVVFENTSQFASSFEWDFGDGSTSNNPFPKHQYTSAGSYLVRLIASSCGESDTTFFNVVANPFSLNEAGVEFSVYPNPSNGLVKINFQEEKDVATGRIYDQRGAFLLTIDLEDQQSELDLSFLPDGVYFISIEIDGSIRTEKIIIQ